jgi:hypothetical protein
MSVNLCRLVAHVFQAAFRSALGTPGPEVVGDEDGDEGESMLRTKGLSFRPTILREGHVFG